MANQIPDKSLPLHLFMLEHADKFFAQGKILSYNDLRTEVLPIWNHITKQQRDAYKLQAQLKKEQIIANIQNIHLHDAKEAEKKREEDIEKCKRVQEHLTKKLKGSKDWKKEIFILADVNIFLMTKDDIYPAEVAMSKFSLHDGLVDSIHFHVDLDTNHEIPHGLFCAAKMKCEETHQIPLDQSRNRMDRITQQEAKEKMQNFLGSDLVVFTLQEKVLKYDFVEAVQRSMKKLFDMNISAATLPQLFKAMKKQDGDSSYENIDPYYELVNNPYEYSTTIGCKFHFEVDSPLYCSLARVSRWAYLICKLMLPPNALKQGKHIPRELTKPEQAVQWIFKIDANEETDEPPQTHSAWIENQLKKMREEEDRAYMEQYKDADNEDHYDPAAAVVLPFCTPPKMKKLESINEARPLAPVMKVEAPKVATPPKPMKKHQNTLAALLTPRVESPKPLKKTVLAQVPPPVPPRKLPKEKGEMAQSTPFKAPQDDFCSFDLGEYLSETYGQETTLAIEDTTVEQDEMYQTAFENLSDITLGDYNEFEQEISAENCEAVETSTSVGMNSENEQNDDDYMGAGSFENTKSEETPIVQKFTTLTLEEILGN